MQAKTSIMALTQWKVLSQIKDYISKFSNDKNLQNALNKEFAHFLQKYQPSVYGDKIVRNLESTVTTRETPKRTEAVVEPKTEQSGLSIPNVLNKLIPTKEEPNTEVQHKWKTTSSTISKVNSFHAA